MEWIEVVDEFPQSADAMVLCVGQFDGMHIGHQGLLDIAKQYITDEILTVLIFSQQMDRPVQGGEATQSLLTPRAEQERLFNQFGVNRLYEVSDVGACTKQSAAALFAEQLTRLNIKRLVVSEGTSFAHDVDITVQTLVDLCAKLDVPITVVPQAKVNGRLVTSACIREHLQAGRVEAAQALLGRPYQITGTIVHGAALGRQLGFPTANFDDVDEYVMVAPGIYVSLVEIHGVNGQKSEYWYALTNAGYRPTVNGQSYLIEAYLLDFTGDLYDKRLSVSFLHRLRDEIKFVGLDPLIEQMHKDTAMAKARLGIEGHA